jgi:DDE superfamily endonuclease
LAGRRLAAHSKKAQAEGAHLVLIDESGFFLNPVVRRTWARKGKTPVLRTFGGHRDKVSVVAALSVAPGRRRTGLYFHADAKHTIGAPTIVAFLREVLGHLRGPVIVLWDSGTNHKGPVIRDLLARYPRLPLEALPTYAPQRESGRVRLELPQVRAAGQLHAQTPGPSGSNRASPPRAKSATSRASSNPFGSAQSYPSQIRTLLN